jgi:protein-S-isoprenylcysteine O-methyltransferase Ste14
MLRERARFTACEGTKSWDRLLVPIVGFYGPVAIMIVAGLGHRLAWSTVIPPLGQVLAALVIAIGYGLAVWAMAVNRYFSSVARIQSDRGQEVVTTGPYKIVRHPSYAGAILASLALPVMLDAVWALIPGLALVIALVVRTALEDRMLREELDGYERYAGRTRHRLVPGLW